jgi:hypothetical protein
MGIKIIIPLIFSLFLLTIVNAQTYGWCYQETTNVSSSCFTLDTGSYDFSDYFYMNYSKSSLANYGTKWRVKHGYPSQEYNITIPFDCFNQTNLTLRILSSWINGGAKQSHPECYNGTDWNFIGLNLSQNSGGEGGGGTVGVKYLFDGIWLDVYEWNGNQAYLTDTIGWVYGADKNNASIYEEGIYWNMTIPPLNIIDFSQLNYIRQFGKVMHNHNVCVDNETLAHNITYQITIDQNQSIVNMWVTEPCEFGCDSSTQSCNPSSINQYLIIGIVLLIILIVIVIIIKVAKR